MFVETLQQGGSGHESSETVTWGYGALQQTIGTTSQLGFEPGDG